MLKPHNYGCGVSAAIPHAMHCVLIFYAFNELLFFYFIQSIRSCEFLIIKTILLEYYRVVFGLVYHQSEFDMAVSTAHSGFFFQPSGGASFMLSGTGYTNSISDKSSSPSTYFTKNLL